MKVLAALLAPIALAQVSTITGTATYRERMALPPDAHFEATLEDVSRAGAAADIIGRAPLDKPGQPPFRFSIAYDPGRIVPSHTYSVRAKITVAGKLMFTSDRAYPVLTQGNGTQVSILLRRAPAAAPNRLGTLPASYRGDLPCADCPGIRYTLNLFADGGFLRRFVYLERNDGKPSDDLGRWSLSEDGAVLHLYQGAQIVDRLAVKSGGTLRKLDLQGREIASKLNYDLQRTPTFEAIEVRAPMTGMFRYMADAATFTECQTGQRWPVAMEGDYRALESAYTKLRREPGDELAASFDGRLAIRPNPDTRQPAPTVVVERYTGVWPGETCGAAMATSPLRETYWKLTRLGHTPVVLAEGQREPHLVFRSAGDRVTGFSGCNNLGGTYTTKENQLTISKVIATQRACLQGMDIESRFFNALNQAGSWKILGEHLELYDAAGAAIARFEARALR